ncbi:MAG: Asp-tRNA(Asn)/Glu-tRNA(Gln) amidotransferase subunit GatA, partial [Syntrophobacterales bacterium]|nr:Asp-tRNA(Asn)/Glu-tRNA(Gln) amidotransferase subunit GatA [Syntrophobacterales bacterium]
TLSTNLAGIPGISVPCGYTKSGLPMGIQFMANHFEEGKLLQIASAYEKNSKIERRRPDL